MVKRARIIVGSTVVVAGVFSAAVMMKAATLSVTPTTLTVSTPQGSTPASQAVTITKVGGGSLKWQVQPSAATWMAESPTGGTNNGTVAVTYSTASLAAGTYQGSFIVTSNGGTATVTVNLTVTAAPPPPTGRGPQTSIACPAGSVDITPGQSIQAAVTAQTAGASFCLKAGSHPIAASITPKSGQTFTGEFGAILDGTGWSSSDVDAAVFRAVNNGVTGVTIRNLTLRQGPSYGVNAYLTATNWTVEFNEIHNFRNGVSVGRNGIIRKNVIHHNAGVFNDPDPARRGGGIVLNCADGTQILDNEIHNNGQEQKVIYGTTNEPNQKYTIKDNFVHHNIGAGIWFDGDGAGSLVENNTVEDNAAAGIVLEATNGVTVQKNFVRRNGEEGILVTISKNNAVTGNVLEGNRFGIGLYIDFASLPPNSPNLPWTQDLANNTISGNTVHIPAGANHGGMMTILPRGGDGSPYSTNTKKNVWANNTYVAPTNTANWFLWNNVAIPWPQWLAVPQDTGSTLTVQP